MSKNGHVCLPVSTKKIVYRLNGTYAELGIPLPGWGLWTIGMSWIPAVFSVLWLMISSRTCSMLYLVRLILWPMLVPLDM